MLNRSVSFSVSRSWLSYLVPNVDTGAAFKVQSHGRGVPLTAVEYEKAMLADPNSPENSRLLKMAIVGAPNSGKSTLVNKIMNWKLSSVSSKVHTTRSKITAILTENETQLLIMDTPGMVTRKNARKHRLESSMLTDPYSSFHEADLVLVLVDAANKWCWSELDPCVSRSLAQFPNKKAILVLNKVDAVRDKSRLLEIARNLSGNRISGCPLGVPLVGKEARKTFRQKTVREIVDEYHDKVIHTENTSTEIERNETDGSVIVREENAIDLSPPTFWPNFGGLFMVSAKTGDGIAELRHFMMQAAPPGQWQYPSRVVVARSPNELVVDVVREQLLELLPSEVPYEIGINIDFWDNESEPGLLRVALFLECPRPRHYQLLLGRNGETVKTVAMNAKQELMNLFRTDMTLKVIARVNRP